MPILIANLDDKSPIDLKFRISKDATLPKIQVKLLDQGEVVDLTGATVVFSMEDEAGTLKITGQAGVVEDELNGIVSYTWSAGDTDTTGRFFGQFKITDVGDYLIPSNNGEKMVIEISDSLAFV